MSVYCLGKLTGQGDDDCRSFLSAAAKNAGMVVSFDVDPEDERVLNEAHDLKAKGTTFVVYSGPSDSDVVRAWNAAREVGLRALQSASGGRELPDCLSSADEIFVPDAVQRELSGTNIGKFVSAVIGREGVLSGGLAFFDGSIREILVQTPEKCLQRILTAFLIPWDCGPDALYVWNRVLS